MKTARYSLIIASAIIFSIFQSLHAQNSKNDPSRWEKDIQSFESWDKKNAWPKEPVLFVGSSSIRMWNSRDSFPDYPVINRGFGGSQISDVNHYIDRIVLKYRPRAIVFYCGDNDIGSGKTPETVLNDYKAFVEQVHQNLPETRIIFISIKPSGSRWNLWPKMDKTNKMIEELSNHSKLLYYADCATPLITAGKPDDSLFLKDRLHLKPAGYKKWVKVVGPMIQKALQK